MERLLLYILTACLIGSCLTGCSYGKKKTKPKHGLIETSLGSLDDLSVEKILSLHSSLKKNLRS